MLHKVEIVVSCTLCHYFHLVVKCRPVWCICGPLFMIIVWCGLGNSRRCSLAVYVPKGLFIGDAFSENLFRCATASHKAFVCGNPKKTGERAWKPFWVHHLGYSLRICPHACGSQQIVAEVLIPSKNIWMF